MALTTVSDGNTVLASDVNQFKNAFEGAATNTFLFKAATATSFTVQLAEAAGATFFRVLDSAGSVVFSVDSDGNVIAAGTVAGSGGFTFPTSASPSQTTDGQASWDSDDDVLTVGTGAATKRVTPYVAASALPANKGEVAYDTTNRVLAVHDGTNVVPIGPDMHKYKTAGQNFVNTTLATVTATSGNIQFPVAANKSYRIVIEGTVSAVGTAASGGFKWGFTFPAAPTVARARVQIMYTHLLSADSITVLHVIQPFGDVTSGTAFGGTNSSNPGVIAGITTGSFIIVFYIVNGANAGDVVFQAAQNTASGTSTLTLIHATCTPLADA